MIRSRNRQYRKLFKSFFFAVCSTGCLLLGCVQAQDKDDSREDTIRALFVTGGGWHDYETQETLLTDALQKHLNIDLTIVHEGEKNPDYHVSVFQEENWADGYDVIIHNTAFGRVTDSDFLQFFVENHKGTPAVLIHASVHSYRYAEPADAWFDFMGFQSMWHEDQRRFVVENLNPEHPVMDGFPDEWEIPVDDELYVTEKIWGDITPLARAYGEESEDYQTVIWTHEKDGNRVFCLTLGHNNGMFEQSEFQQLVANGVRWAVKDL